MKEIKNLDYGLTDSYGKAGMISKVIPDAHSHKPFEELKKLSLLGLAPA
jgi:hypothetical protein